MKIIIIRLKDDGGVYLGLKEGIDKNQMLTDLKCAQEVIFHLMLKSMSISFMLKTRSFLNTCRNNSLFF
ncbi:MAG: hypothetical protein ACLR43_04255 [Faecalibacillus faecis]